MTPGTRQAPSTSVKVKVDDKQRLDRLQARLTARRGRKITQQDLFTELLNLAERHRDSLEGWKPLSKTERDRLMRLPAPGRLTRGEEHIDEDIYGGEV